MSEMPPILQIRYDCMRIDNFVQSYWLNHIFSKKSQFCDRFVKPTKKNSRVTQVSRDLVWVDFDFCQIPISPSRTGQTVEHSKSKSTKPSLSSLGIPCTNLPVVYLMRGFVFQDIHFDKQKVLAKCSRQFYDARARWRAIEKASLPGTFAAAGRVKVPDNILDNVVWKDPESDRSYVRIPGLRTIMIFQVLHTFS